MLVTFPSPWTSPPAGTLVSVGVLIQVSPSPGSCCSAVQAFGQAQFPSVFMNGAASEPVLWFEKGFVCLIGASGLLRLMSNCVCNSNLLLCR